MGWQWVEARYGGYPFRRFGGGVERVDNRGTRRYWRMEATVSTCKLKKACSYLTMRLPLPGPESALIPLGRLFIYNSSF